MVVDRSDKRLVLYATQSGSAVLALALGFLVSTNHVSLGAIWSVAALLGIVNLFDNPARQAFVQEMVGRKLLRTPSLATPPSSTSGASSARPSVR